MRFLLVGGAGFVIDAGTTWFLVAENLDRWLARIPAIALAMIFTWLANRTFTYRTSRPRSLGEGVRYGMVATGLALMNYLTFLLVSSIGIPLLGCVVLATALQAVVGFSLYRRLVFNEEKGAK